MPDARRPSPRRLRGHGWPDEWSTMPARECAAQVRQELPVDRRELSSAASHLSGVSAINNNPTATSKFPKILQHTASYRDVMMVCREISSIYSNAKIWNNLATGSMISIPEDLS